MPAGPCPTIAVVEDDASCRRAVERLLRASGFEAHPFASAEAFLASAAPESHACLILDVHLPGMSAFELIHQLRACGPPRPAVFITAHDERSARERAAGVAGSVYLRKPFAGAALLESVRSLLRRSGASAGSPDA